MSAAHRAFLRDVDRALGWDTLAAANAFHRTRAQGRMVVSDSGAHGRAITLHLTIGPAILTNVPPFTRALVDAVAGEGTLARKFLAHRGVTGNPYRLAPQPT